MAGEYSGVSITNDAGKRDAASDVIVRPASGAKVTVQGELKIEGSHVEIRDVTVNGDWEIDPAGSQPTSHVTMRNVDATNFYINSSTDVNVLGGNLGPTTNSCSHRLRHSTAGPSRHDPRPQGARFHDYVRTDPNVHMECLQVLAADGIIVRGNKFERCAIMDLYFSQFGSAGATQNVLVENNFFDAPTSGGFYAVYVGAQLGVPPKKLMFRNNSALDTMHVETSAGVDNVSFIGNVGPRAQYNCPDGVTFAYNVWDAAKCGPTDTRAPLGFKDPAAVDLHLVAGAAAVNRGDPKSFPSSDIDGQQRPRGKRPDAGADEAG